MLGTDDVMHLLSRYGPFVLAALWAVAVAITKRGQAAQRAVETPPEPVAVQRPPVRRRPMPAVPPAVSGAYAAFQQRATPPESAPLDLGAGLADLGPEPEQLAANLAAADAQEHRFRFGGSSWAQAIVLAEVVGPPLALRRPGTLHVPSAF